MERRVFLMYLIPWLGWPVNTYDYYPAVSEVDVQQGPSRSHEHK